MPAIQRTAVAAYGAAADATSARRLAASVCHASTACGPTTGSVPSHAGGAGIVNERRLAAQSTISPALETIVPMASDSGRTSTSSNAPIIAATASFRLPQSQTWSCRITGHVATTIIEAQMTAPRKGRRIQIVNAISTTMIRTPSVARGRSAEGSVACVGVTRVLYAPATLATSTASSTVVNAMPTSPSSTTSERAAGDTGRMSP